MTNKRGRLPSFLEWLRTQPVDLKSRIGIALYGAKIHILGVLYEDHSRAVLHEGKWIGGRFDRNIRIDRNSHFASTNENGLHGHIYGRRDRDNALVVVKFDGTMSHGKGGTLHSADADALRAHGFRIPGTNIVEYVIVASSEATLLTEQLRIS